MRKRRWSELTAAQKSVIALASTVQIGLLVAALVDIYRRPDEKIRGDKRAWAVAAFINFVGPISYFIFGRKQAQR